MTTALDVLDKFLPFGEFTPSGGPFGEFLAGRDNHDADVRAAIAASAAYTTTRVIDDHIAASGGYLAHFGARTIVAVGRALQVIPTLPAEWLDLGAGSGAASLVLACAGAKQLSLIDRSDRALATAKRLLRTTGAAVSTTTAPMLAGASQALGVVAAFALGELPVAPSWAELSQVAPKAQWWVLVDAGDHPRARRLQQLRAEALAAGMHVWGPCPHADACPALARDADWCHDIIAKDLPPRLAAFSTAVGRNANDMNVSWLVLHTAPPTRDDQRVVTIGDARAEKGRVRVPVCGADRLRFVQALSRHREVHDHLLALGRGATISLVSDDRRTDPVVGTDTAMVTAIDQCAVVIP